MEWQSAVSSRQSAVSNQRSAIGRITYRSGAFIYFYTIYSGLQSSITLYLTKALIHVNEN